MTSMSRRMPNILRTSAQKKQWASRWTNAPKQNFCFITVKTLIKKHPEYATQREMMTKIANLPDRLCSVCGQFNVWKMVRDKIPDNDMCFTCITGETAASDDYELLPT